METIAVWTPTEKPFDALISRDLDLLKISIIVNKVHLKMNLNPRGVALKDKSHSLTLAKHASWLLARQLTQFSYPDLGLLFGRDHTTIICGINSLKQRKNLIPWLNQLLKEILEEIRNQDISIVWGTV